MKSQLRHTVWCNISGEAAGEIWTLSLLRVKGLRQKKLENSNLDGKTSTYLKTWAHFLDQRFDIRIVRKTLGRRRGSSHWELGTSGHVGGRHGNARWWRRRAEVLPRPPKGRQFLFLYCVAGSHDFAKPTKHWHGYQGARMQHVLLYSFKPCWILRDTWGSCVTLAGCTWHVTHARLMNAWLILGAGVYMNDW